MACSVDVSDRRKQWLLGAREGSHPSHIQVFKPQMNPKWLELYTEVSL